MIRPYVLKHLKSQCSSAYVEVEASVLTELLKNYERTSFSRVRYKEICKLAANLEYLYMCMTFPRRVGRTKALCEVANKLDAVVLANTKAQAFNLNQEFGVKAESVRDTKSLVGRRSLVLADHYTVANLAYEAFIVLDEFIKEQDDLYDA